MMQPKMLERAVLTKLLEGDGPVLLALRRQLDVVTVVSRRMTGSGFFTMFALPSDIAPAPVKKTRFGDVEAKVQGLKHGAGFLVYVDDGKLHALEGYSYEEPWPDSVESFELRTQMRHDRPLLGLSREAVTAPSPQSINVNAALGSASPFPGELEVPVPGGIPPGNVRAVTIVSNGVSHLNPNWVP